MHKCAALVSVIKARFWVRGVTNEQCVVVVLFVARNRFHKMSSKFIKPELNGIQLITVFIRLRTRKQLYGQIGKAT